MDRSLTNSHLNHFSLPYLLSSSARASASEVFFAGNADGVLQELSLHRLLTQETFQLLDSGLELRPLREVPVFHREPNVAVAEPRRSVVSEFLTIKPHVIKALIFL
jgi:hypothetical protein